MLLAIPTLMCPTKEVAIMPTVPSFSAQLLGQTEKAANAILDRLLAEPRLSEPQWVTLSITAMTGGALARDPLADRVAGALKVSDGEAQQRIAELADRRFLHTPDDDHAPVTLTDHGWQVHAQVRAATTEITHRLWGDLPAEDLATAGRVLDTVLARANVEVATG
jgi:DNA-binding MarR family transcriptional regulator